MNRNSPIQKIKSLTPILVSGLGLFSCNSKPAVESKNEQPNIIIILADDMGFSDLGCFGGEISTPNLDKLASEGVRCSHFYSAARCCPSRASLLSGLYPHQAGMGHMSDGLKLKPNNEHIESYQGYLPENVPTIGDLLSSSGYTTLLSGKWHVGDDEEHFPYHHGFDQCKFMPWGSHYFSTKENIISLDSEAGKIFYPDTNLYMTDIITNNALEMLNSSPKDKPFFLYLGYNAPHTPLQAPDSVIEKYMPIYANGWESLRNQRFENLKKIGLIPKEAAIPGIAEDYADVNFDWESLSANEKWYLQRTMATFAAMVDILDQNVGRLISYLEESNKLDNTVIFFFSDNGGTNEGHYPKNKTLRSAIPGKPGHNGGPGPWWGRLSNTPYRMYKAYANEGGISEPFIAYSPKYFAQNKIISKHYFHIMDIMPTCLDLAGTRYPDTFNQLPVKTPYHQSMLPYLVKENFTEDTLNNRLICWEHQGHKGVRKGKWKLTYIREYYYDIPSTNEHKSEMVNQWGLYNLEEDPFENNNLYDQFPDIVKELKADFDQWAEQNGVVDWDRVNIWD